MYSCCVKVGMNLKICRLQVVNGVSVSGKDFANVVERAGVIFAVINVSLWIQLQLMSGNEIIPELL